MVRARQQRRTDARAILTRSDTALPSGAVCPRSPSPTGAMTRLRSRASAAHWSAPMNWARKSGPGGRPRRHLPTAGRAPCMARVSRRAGARPGHHAPGSYLAVCPRWASAGNRPSRRANLPRPSDRESRPPSQGRGLHLNDRIAHREPPLDKHGRKGAAFLAPGEETAGR